MGSSYGAISLHYVSTCMFVVLYIALSLRFIQDSSANLVLGHRTMLLTKDNLICLIVSVDGLLLTGLGTKYVKGTISLSEFYHICFSSYCFWFQLSVVFCQFVPWRK